MAMNIYMKINYSLQGFGIYSQCKGSPILDSGTYTRAYANKFMGILLRRVTHYRIIF